MDPTSPPTKPPRGVKSPKETVIIRIAHLPLQNNVILFNYPKILAQLDNIVDKYETYSRAHSFIY